MPDDTLQTPAGANDAAVEQLTATIGARVREARRERGLSRRALSETSGVSQRYLAQVEAGAGNISVALLLKIGMAVGQNVAWFVRGGTEEDDAGSVAERYARANPDVQAEVRRLLGGDGGRPRARRIALIGLRGAGKSTLGQAAAERLGLPFVELNDRIEAEGGMTVADIMALYGQDGYRRLESQALAGVAGDHDRVILAAAGGIVSDAGTFGLLRERFHTIWLRALPDEHMERVRAQGDERPMAGNPAALDELKAILRERERLYAQADAVLDTSAANRDQTLEALLGLIDRAGIPGLTVKSRTRDAGRMLAPTCQHSCRAARTSLPARVGRGSGPARGRRPGTPRCCCGT